MRIYEKTLDDLVDFRAFIYDSFNKLGFAANNDSQSFEKRSTKYGNQIFVDASVLNLFHYNEELTNHINTPGNSIVFYGVGLDKKVCTAIYSKKTKYQ
ncbi:hypothetical protein L5D93_09970 [Paenibacillus thiaminolyticus]|nr:hypothetical protein [Paenibacillus thiaminolyticus]